MNILWDFCYYTIPLSLNNKHAQILILYKVPSLGVHNLESDAPIPTKLVFFFHCYFYVDILSKFDSYLLRSDKYTRFPNTPRKIKEALDYNSYYFETWLT